MKVITEILNHPLYINALQRLEDYEKQRIYCKHNSQHFLDVARIGYILALEQNVTISKEVIYACGVLHDIGRYLEYEKGIAHNEASCELAREILENSLFSEVDKKSIYKAILNHRNQDDDVVSEILRKADRLSRNCFDCESQESCHWSDQKKNLEIEY